MKMIRCHSGVFRGPIQQVRVRLTVSAWQKIPNKDLQTMRGLWTTRWGQAGCVKEWPSGCMTYHLAIIVVAHQSQFHCHAYQTGTTFCSVTLTVVPELMQGQEVTLTWLHQHDLQKPTSERCSPMRTRWKFRCQCELWPKPEGSIS